MRTGTVHLAINPAGTTAYVIEQFGNSVRELDLASNHITATIPLTNSGFNIIVSKDGKRVYASTGDGRLYVIATETRSIVDSMVIGPAANGFTLSPDGSVLYASSRDVGTITGFRTSDDAQIATYDVGGRPQRLAMSPDGTRLYAANEDSGLSVVDLTTGTVLPPVNPIHSGYGLGLTPDGAQLYLTNPRSGEVAIIDRGSLQTVNVLAVGGVPRNVAFSADGTTGVVTDGNGRVIFIQSGTVVATTPLGGQPYGLAINGAGDLLVAQVLADSVTRFALPGTTPVHATFFGIPEAADSAQYFLKTGTVHLAINPAGTTAYVIEQFGNTVREFDLASNTITATIPLTNSGYNIIVSKDGERVYASTEDGRLYVIATHTKSIVDSMAIGPAANGFTLSPDGSLLYASSRNGGTITAFRTSDDAKVATYDVGGRPQRLAMAPDGTRLYAANQDSGLSVVDLATGTVLPPVNPIHSGYGLALTPDGAQLYLTNPATGEVAIIDRASLQTVNVLAVGGVPRNVAFSADGTIGVVTDGNGRVIFIQ